MAKWVKLKRRQIMPKTHSTPHTMTALNSELGSMNVRAHTVTMSEWLERRQSARRKASEGIRW